MKKILLTTLALVIVVPIVALADQKTAEERAEAKAERIEAHQEKMEERKEAHEEKMEERKEHKCERIENRIRTRLNRYENNQSTHQKVFSRLVERLERLSEVLKSKGRDVETLNSFIAVLKTKVDELDALHADFIAELKETQAQACGDSEGEFRKQLGEARKVIPEVREKISEIREYYRDTIRPEILKLAKQLDNEDDSVDIQSNE